MTWIAFSEREPTPDEKEGGLWFGSSRGRRQYPWYPNRGFESYGAARATYTHFSPVEAPTDLPPKPLPELSEGSKWSKARTFPSIMREGSRYWISESGKWLTVLPGDGRGSIDIPMRDIDALKEAGK